MLAPDDQPSPNSTSKKKMIERLSGVTDSRPLKTQGIVDEKAPLAEKLAGHPLLGSVDRADSGKASKLKNIDASEFSRALIDVLRSSEPAPDDPGGNLVAAVEAANLLEPIENQLKWIISEGSEDIARIRTGLEHWFDGHMEQVSSWYRQRARVWRRQRAYLVG